mgnify:CR=1 FL=1
MNHNKKAKPQKTVVVVDLNAQRRRRGERQTDGKRLRRREKHVLPAVGPNRISVDYLRAA